MKELETNAEGMNLMTKMQNIIKILVVEDNTVIVDSEIENGRSSYETNRNERIPFGMGN